MNKDNHKMIAKINAAVEKIHKLQKQYFQSSVSSEEIAHTLATSLSVDLTQILTSYKNVLENTKGSENEIDETVFYAEIIKSILDRAYGKEVVFYDSGDWYSRDHGRNITLIELMDYSLYTISKITYHNIEKESDETLVYVTIIKRILDNAVDGESVFYRNGIWHSKKQNRDIALNELKEYVWRSTDKDIYHN